ncbi:MAG TPA: DUF368 domain-containing protein [Acholeplasma sp.]|nr:DUF368 domain-containing protein [Acholeplasma sp.]
MRTILKTIKGLLVGFIIIIPGISGSMIAAALNIYEDIISALSNLTKNPIKALKSIWEYILGMIIGLGLGVVFVATVYTKYPLQLTGLFIGLIIGGIPALIKQNKGQFKKWYHYLTIIISMAVMASLLFIPRQSADDQGNGQIFLYAIMGLLIAGPIVIPGISGAMVLTMVGFYNKTMNTIKNFLKNLFTFNFSMLFDDLGAVLFMGIGGIVGLVIFAKVIKYILEKYPKVFNAIILGVLLIAPISIVVSLDKELISTGSSIRNIINTGNISVSSIFLVFGFLLSYRSSNMKEREVNSTEVLNIFRTTKFMLIDVFIIGLSYALTVLVFDVVGYSFDYPDLTASFLTLTLAKITLYYFLGLYKIIIKHLDYKNLLKIIVLVILSNILIVGFLLLPNMPLFMYKSAYVFITAIEIAGFITYRVIAKMYEQYKDRTTKSGFVIPTLIIGAGSAGEMALKEIDQNKQLNNFVVGFLDDDHKKRGRTIMNKPVLGTVDEVEHIINKYNIGEVVIAIAEYSKEDITTLTSKININPHVRVKRLVMIGEYIDNNQPKIKDINVEDLLNRTSNKMDLLEVKDLLKEQVVLITGGGGSIGSEIARRIINFEVKKIIIFDFSENSTYDLQIELNNMIMKNPDIKTEIIPVVGSVYNYERLDEIFNKYQPTVIFHAAAYKHVALMEGSSVEAIRTNVLGTKNVCELANKHKVNRVVIISGDKAINPKSVVGFTKKYAELIGRYFNKIGNTKVSIIRFGNIIGARGSVVPIFQKQIENGGPVTITDKKTTRYFMTKQEIVSLILETLIYSNGGETFIFDMGEPVNIYNLAKRMITLSGLIPYQDIDIKIIGLRPGEKLHEEKLINKKEKQYINTPNQKIIIENNNDYNFESEEFGLLIARNQRFNNEHINKILEYIKERYKV